MHDPVVQAVLGPFADNGISTARFNFRSGFGRGWQSMDDCVGVCRCGFAGQLFLHVACSRHFEQAFTEAGR
jgi:hypothetical protein